VRLDEPRETQQFEQVRVDRTPPRPPAPEPVWQAPAWETPSWATPSWTPPAAEPRPWDEPVDAPPTGWTSAPLPPLSQPEAPGTSLFPASPLPPGAASRLPSPPSADRWSPASEPDLAPRRSRHSGDAEEPAAAAPPTSAFPLTPPLLPSEPPAPRARPETPPRRRRSDEPTAVPVPSEFAPTTQNPVVPGRPSPGPRATPAAPSPPASTSPSTAPSTVARPEFDRSAFRFAAPEAAPSSPSAPNPDLARILAENGSGPATGSRRRRRYRDDDDSDDVLARVLRGD
jgi:hypothetical protein